MSWLGFTVAMVVPVLFAACAEGTSASEAGGGEEATAGPGSGGSAGAGGAGCKGGAEEACYSGPEGTQGVGNCVGGTRTCNKDGSGWGPCVGEIVPSEEDCAKPEDEDCDGEAPRCPGAALWSA